MGTGAWALLGTIALALAGFSGVVYNGRQRRREREEDRQEREHVAEQVRAAAVRAKEAAELLSTQQVAAAAEIQERAALLAKENALAQQRAEEAEQRAREVADSLRVIHGLVDGNLTRAQQRQLHAMRESMVFRKEVMDLKAERGIQPTAEDLAAVEDAQKRIDAIARDLLYKVDLTSPERAAKTKRPDAEGDR